MADQLLDAIRSAYGFAATQAVPVPGGLVHRSWRLSSAGGTWFVKWYRGRAWGRAALGPTLRAQAVAADAGLPVPRPIADRTGRTCVPWQGGLLVVSEWLSGESPAHLTVAMGRAAGAALGRLHVALGAIPAGDAWVPDPLQVAERTQEVLTLCEAWPNPGPGDRLAAQSLLYRLEALRQPGIDAGRYAGCTWQVCHGDYFPPNLLFEGDQLTGIVDFDFAAPRWRALELARAAVEVARQPDGALASPLYRAVVEGYLAANLMPPEEYRAGPRLWWEYLLHSNYPIGTRYRDPESLPDQWEALLRRRHDLMVWLGEHMAELAALI